jgi:hypothetical protein
MMIILLGTEGFYRHALDSSEKILTTKRTLSNLDGGTTSNAPLGIPSNNPLLFTLSTSGGMNSLTVSFVEQVIDESLNGKDATWQKDLHEQGWHLRRAATPTEWRDLIKKTASTGTSTTTTTTTTFCDGEEEELSYQVPYFFGIGIYSREPHETSPILCGVITFYMAYSTWDARCVFLDRLDLPTPADANVEKTILRALANIAVRLQCGRLCWEVRFVLFSWRYLFVHSSHRNRSYHVLY